MSSTISYIAFLRGINVGGHRVQMAHLRALFAELGLADVRSYIQSGNVFFRTSNTDIAALERHISAHIGKKLGYEVPTFIRTVTEMDELLHSNPFAGIDITSNIRLCVLLCSSPLPSNLVMPHEMMDGGVKITILSSVGNTVFLVMDQQSGRPGNPVSRIEKEFSLGSTMRFYHTTQKILAAEKDTTVIAD